MADLTLVNQQRQAMGALTRLALQDVVGMHRSLPAERPVAYRSAVFALLPSILDKWGDAAATLAADYYDESRAAAGLTGRFRAELAEVRTNDAAGLTQWATQPLWAKTPVPEEVLRRLAGGTERLVRMAERDTIEVATGTDPAGPKLQRVTRSNACGFCLMLASRGAEHVDMTKYRRRTKGKGWHNHCRCGLAPVFGDGRDDYPDPDELYAEWAQVTKGLSASEARREWDRVRRAGHAGGAGGGAGPPTGAVAADDDGELRRLTEALDVLIRRRIREPVEMAEVQGVLEELQAIRERLGIRGVIDERVGRFKDNERPTVELLASEGRNVVHIPPKKSGASTPDAGVDAVLTEFKSFTGKNSETLVGRVAEAQAPIVVVHHAVQNLSASDAVDALQKLLDTGNTQLAEIRVWGDGYDVVLKPRGR